MANIEIRDGDGTEKHLKATGAGSAGDPFIPEHKETSATAILAAVQAIQVSAEILDNVVSGNEAQVDIITLPADPLGTSSDAAATAGSTGSISAKLRLMTTQLNTIASTLAGTLTVGLPSGAASAANQTTANNALAAIQASAEILDNAIAGDEMQVDVVAPLPAGTNNIGDVDVASIAAGENVIGRIGASDTVVTVTPTLDTNAYTSGDLLFDSTEIASAVRANGYTAILQSITIVDKDDQGAAMTLLFANAATDFGTINSAPDPDDTEAATVIAVIDVSAGDWVDLGGAKVQSVPSSALGQLLKAGGATTSLYVAAMTGGTPTHTASGLVFQFGFLRS